LNSLLFLSLFLLLDILRFVGSSEQILIRFETDVMINIVTFAFS